MHREVAVKMQATQKEEEDNTDAGLAAVTFLTMMQEVLARSVCIWISLVLLSVSESIWMMLA